MMGDFIIASLGYGLTGLSAVLGVASFTSAFKMACVSESDADREAIGIRAFLTFFWLLLALGLAVLTRALLFVGVA